MPSDLIKVLSELKSKLAHALADNLLLLTLYGSHARNEADADSDVDLLVVLRKSTPEAEALVRNIVYETMWQIEFTYYLSLYLIDQNHYRKLEQYNASILKNIEKDGQVLWEAT